MSVYREYFREEIAQHLDDTTIEPWVMNQMEQGGELATDIFLAVRDSRKAEDPDTEPGLVTKTFLF